MIVIYTNKNTPRLQYTMNLVFATVLGVDYQILTNQQSFINSNFPKLSYFKSQIESEIHFTSTSLLFENTIITQNIDVKTTDYLPTFYHHHNKNAALSYDCFAMIFYLVSRYEEYTNEIKDKHNRFKAKESLAYQNDFLKIPLVNHLCLLVKDIISAEYPNFQFPKRKFQYLPTYDIDYAWAYKNRDLKRTIGGYLRSLLSGNFKEIQTRIRVQINQKQDPFYTFEYLDEVHKKYQLSPIYFFLIGDYSEFDKNIHFEQKDFRQLIRIIAKKYEFGLHPSYLSNNDIQQLQEEQRRLAEITNQEIRQSRQHFLKLSLPKTYRNLLSIGIKKDFTMGYAAEIGFRASIANAYFWYDLEKETATDLEVVPFQVMDVTLRDYLKLSPTEAIREIQLLIKNTKIVNGIFCTLWHNSTLDDAWKEIYESVFDVQEKID